VNVAGTRWAKGEEGSQTRLYYYLRICIIYWLKWW